MRGWILLALFTSGLICISARAERRFWRTQSSSRGYSVQQYYSPPVTATQNYGVNTQSGVVHNQNSSSAQHRYDVSRQYTHDVNGNPANGGEIRYSGGRDRNYVHDGSYSATSQIDTYERAKAEENKLTASTLDSIAKCKVQLQTVRVLAKAEMHNGTVSADAHYRMSQVDIYLERALDNLAKGAQADNDAWGNYYVKLSVRDMAFAMEWLEYHDATYNKARLAKTRETRILILVLAALLP